MKLDNLKHGLNSAWDSVTEGVTEGWHRLRDSAASALTRFNPGEHDNLPSSKEVNDEFYFPSTSWGMLASNVFEDDDKIVVQLEIPGMDKKNFQIEVHGNLLQVSGEKSFEREQGEGRYHTFQCAYGSFRRSVRLPAAVISEQANASYRNGILRIELPKEAQEKPKRIEVKID